ncbi:MULTISPECIES: ribokinase [unclassified Aureimonas]|uniref:ribokinase n=1 Tax=unclassified Aureimonas TaxID=2615206 RepID=UPI0006F46201|nr:MULTISPECIES: ribokinase [unclassified Aureimonas]KQT52774.1 ribokinase [Aureimonas sp. Leaf427]KQT80233.1 ribokinase [Aureimonas sp. Leaf460]
MSARIAVVGSNMMDLVTYVGRMPEAGETLDAPAFAMGHGGKGANQAVAAARLGSDVVMVSKVGDDAFADAQLKNFAANGIDTAHVGRAEGASGVATILVEESGENRILIVRGANDRLSPADVDAAGEALRSAKLILLQMEVPLETVYRTVAFAAEHGIETLVNPAPAVAGLDPARIASATFVVPNETELALLTGLPTGTEAEVEAAARSLIARGIKVVIVTLGSRGALLVEAAGVHHVKPIRVEPVDTTGAGDAFIGSFAHFYAGGMALREALDRAAAYAGHSITRRGTQSSYATAEEFAALATKG